MQNENIALSLDFIRGVGGTLADNAWYGSGDTKMRFLSGRNVLEVAGHTYDCAYEDYTADFYIVLNGETIYGRNSRCTGPYQIEVYNTGKFERLEDAFAYLVDVLEGGYVKKFVAPHIDWRADKKERALVLENEEGSFLFYYNSRELTENEEGIVVLSDGEINSLEDTFIETGVENENRMVFSENFWSYPPSVRFELKKRFEEFCFFVCKNRDGEYFSVICDEEKRPLIWEKIKLVARKDTDWLGDYKSVPAAMFE